MTLRTAAPQAANAGEEDEDPTLPGIAAPEPFSLYDLFRDESEDPAWPWADAGFAFVGSALLLGLAWLVAR